MRYKPCNPMSDSRILFKEILTLVTQARYSGGDGVGKRRREPDSNKVMYGGLS